MTTFADKFMTKAMFARKPQDQEGDEMQKLSRHLSHPKEEPSTFRQIYDLFLDQPIGTGCNTLAKIAADFVEADTAKKEGEIARLTAEIGAIEAGLGKEYGPGDKRSGDLIDDFTEFLEHHKATEAKLQAQTPVLEKAQEDVKRLDWLEASGADLHCDVARKWTLWAKGNQHDAMPTARAAIDDARAASTEEGANPK